MFLLTARLQGGRPGSPGVWALEFSEERPSREKQCVFHPAVVVYFCVIAAWRPIGRSDQGERPDETLSGAAPATEDEPYIDRASQQIHHEGTYRRVPFMRPDGAILWIKRNQHFLDEILRLPRWLHPGLHHRDRYESHNEPVRKGETTGAEQVALQTLAQRARMIHDDSYCNHRATRCNHGATGIPAATSQHAKSKAKGLSAATSSHAAAQAKLGMAGRLAPHGLNVPFHVRLRRKGLRVPVSQGVSVVS